MELVVVVSDAPLAMYVESRGLRGPLYAVMSLLNVGVSWFSDYLQG